MSTAVQSKLRPKTISRKEAAQPQPLQNKTTHLPPALKLVPEPPSSPKLRLLLKARRFSTPVAFAMVLGVLPLYGWSVVTQLSWGKRYDNLEQLRRVERQYETLTETLKHDVTQNAQQHSTNLVPQGPHNTLLLPSLQARPKVPVSSSPRPFKPDLHSPLAY